jgi:hypothetical protein
MRRSASADAVRGGTHRLGARAPLAAGVGSRLPAWTAHFQIGFHSEKCKRAAVFMWQLSEWFQTKVQARRSFQLLFPSACKRGGGRGGSVLQPTSCGTALNHLYSSWLVVPPAA